MWWEALWQQEESGVEKRQQSVLIVSIKREMLVAKKIS